MTPADRDDHDDDDSDSDGADLVLPAPPRDAPVCIGYSGGLDSTVLLHALASLTQIRSCGLRALHVHHGLHADADTWAAHCGVVCASLGVPLTVVRVDIDGASGLGREGAARQARHRAFADALHDGEILALAHHRDDQVETVLLRALRGSGIDGIAAIRPWRVHGRGWLWRPLLAHPRTMLRAHAVRRCLRWIEDPSNLDESFDRNFVRQRVMPLLQTRWPHADASFARVAALAGDAADLLEAGDIEALASVISDEPRQLDVEAVIAITPARRARVLRRWITGLDLPPLPASGIARIEADLLTARPDATARFDWHGTRVQRWRGRLHAGPIIARLPADYRVQWDGRGPLRLPTGARLHLAAAQHDADAAADANTDAASNNGAGAAQTSAIHFDAPLTVHARRGGERILLPGRTQSQALKKVLLDLAVPPWRRALMPLLSDTRGTLLAAGDVALDGGFAAWLQARRLRLVHGPLA